MKNLVIFASGNGSNFEAIVNACTIGEINAKVVLLVCDRKDAFVIERAKKLNIDILLVSLIKEKTKEAYEQKIIDKLKTIDFDLICLAGYMKIIGNTLLKEFPNKIINIHPSLLPLFKGKSAILDAFVSKSNIYGVTVHHVDELVDNGKIILQQQICYVGDNLDELTKKVHEVEYKVYVKAINIVLEECNESIS